MWNKPTCHGPLRPFHVLRGLCSMELHTLREYTYPLYFHSFVSLDYCIRLLACSHVCIIVCSYEEYTYHRYTTSLWGILRQFSRDKLHFIKLSLQYNSVYAKWYGTFENWWSRWNFLLSIILFGDCSGMVYLSSTVLCT
jgi:hypothetical protein